MCISYNVGIILESTQYGVRLKECNNRQDFKNIVEEIVNDIPVLNHLQNNLVTFNSQYEVISILRSEDFITKYIK